MVLKVTYLEGMTVAKPPLPVCCFLHQCNVCDVRLLLDRSIPLPEATGCFIVCHGPPWCVLKDKHLHICADVQEHRGRGGMLAVISINIMV